MPCNTSTPRSVSSGRPGDRLAAVPTGNNESRSISGSSGSIVAARLLSASCAAPLSPRQARRISRRPPARWQPRRPAVLQRPRCVRRRDGVHRRPRRRRGLPRPARPPARRHAAAPPARSAGGLRLPCPAAPAARRPPIGKSARGDYSAARAASARIREWPVISSGCFNPISCSSVGATSASLPSWIAEAPPPIRNTGTGLVVCAV